MKTRKQASPSTASLLAFSLLLSVFFTDPAFSSDTPAPQAIGIYDSRVVSYAWFWSERGTRKREDLVAAARAAKSADDPERSREADAALRAFREESHLQVFSTAPVDGILAEIEAELPAIMQEAGVFRLVSMWERVTLDTLAAARQVDVTDALVAAVFTPNEKQTGVITAIKRQEHLALDKARDLLRQGKL